MPHSLPVWSVEASDVLLSRIVHFPCLDSAFPQTLSIAPYHSHFYSEQWAPPDRGSIPDTVCAR